MLPLYLYLLLLCLRFIPNHLCLAIAELDEKHLSVFNFRNREGLVNLMTGNSSIEKIRLALITQISQKHVLASAVQQAHGCYNEIRSEELDTFAKKVKMKNNFIASSPSQSSTRLDPSKMSTTSLTDRALSTKLSKCILRFSKYI